MQMHNPAHPGEVIRESCLKPLGMTVTAAAEGLGVTRKALSDLLNGHSGVSPEMAIRLEKAGWSTADAWLRMQAAHSLWQAASESRRTRSRSADFLDLRPHSLIWRGEPSDHPGQRFATSSRTGVSTLGGAFRI